MPLDGFEAFLANPARRGYEILGTALRPAPLLDLNQWAEDNVVFEPSSPFPGRYDPNRLPFFRRILEVLSPADAARIVAIKKSAQLGGTLLAQIFIGAALDLDPGGVLYTHPTEDNAVRWVNTKWWPMVRSIDRLRAHFLGKRSKEGGSRTLYQERRDGRGHLIISGANSAASLSMITVKRQVQDDLAKWSDNDGGDPEAQADSRSAAYRDAKIAKIGTGLLAGTCRITRAFDGGTQEHFHVPCPHCGHMQPLEPENFIANISDDHPERACFVCLASDCGGVIEEKHRLRMVRAGQWVAHNPGAPYPSFYIWAVYAPFRSWEDYARSWLAARGDPKSEQTWWNDVAGNAYELPGQAPDWEDLKKRAEVRQRLRGVVPIGALLLTLTLDVQDDFLDGVVYGWGRELRRWVVDRVRIEGHISTPETRAELNTLVERAWPTAAGSRRRVDLTGIDANAWTDDVFDWAKQFSRHRVIMVRGVPGDAAPTLAMVRRERRRDGQLVKYMGRFFNVGVSGLKGALYKFLGGADPDMRGYVDFPAGLEDDFYAQLTAEKRTPVIDRKGFTVYQWVKPRSARNEILDCSVYAEALAGKLGWRTLTPAGWAALGLANRSLRHAANRPFY
jgi:phage terminase large subunit GpA-like protein